MISHFEEVEFSFVKVHVAEDSSKNSLHQLGQVDLSQAKDQLDQAKDQDDYQNVCHLFNGQDITVVVETNTGCWQGEN